MSPLSSRRNSVVAPSVTLITALGGLIFPIGALALPALPSGFMSDLEGASGAHPVATFSGSLPPAPVAPAAPGLAAAAEWYDFGTPTQVVSREEIPEDGLTLVTFSNGVTLALKPTRFVADEILINVTIDGGLRALDVDSQPAAELGEQIFAASGVGLKTRDELIGMFGDAASSIELTMYDPFFTLQGQGRTRDLDGLLQVLSAYLTDPGWRAEPLESAKAAEARAWAQIRESPNVWLEWNLRALVRDGDPRWSVPTESEIEAVGIDDVRRVLERPLGLGAIHLAVVGDFDREEAIAAVAARFGSAHSRRVESVKAVQGPPFTSHAGEQFEVTHTGDPDRSAATVVWLSEGMRATPKDRLVGAVLGSVLVDRLNSLPAYSEAVFSRAGGTPAYRGIAVEGQRSALVNARSDVFQIARDLADERISEEELALAREHSLGAFQPDNTNRYWLISLIDMKGDPQRWDEKAAEIKRAAKITALESVTAEEVQDFAARYLREEFSLTGVSHAEPGTP